MRIAIYATGNDIEQQIALCQKYVELKKAELCRVYVDEGFDTHSGIRKNLVSLIKDAEMQAFDVIVTNGHDRLYTDIPNIRSFLKKMKGLGISYTVVHNQ